MEDMDPDTGFLGGCSERTHRVQEIEWDRSVTGIQLGIPLPGRLIACFYGCYVRRGFRIKCVLNP